jgi:hypothetical protein
MPHDPPIDGATARKPASPLGDTRGKLLFIDAPSGVAGDMLVAALVDLGVGEAVIRDAAAALPLDGYELRFERCMRSGIAATRFDVRVDGEQPSRDHATIRTLIAGSAGLSEGTRRLALDAFAVLAEAEAQVHDTTPERVGFHEVGAVDSIIDIVAVAAALDHLGVDVACSPLPMGRGIVESAHGMIPLPAPATVLCLRGVPTYDAGIDAELVTPTGAVLVRVASRAFVRWPRMQPERVGWGAGTRELPDRPNLLRVVLGSPSDARLALQRGTCVVLELNVDDMTGEIAADALERARERGALDAWSTPIGMKHGRPALMLSALARRDDVESIARALLSESTSLGLRVREVDRLERPRRTLEVATSYGPIVVKVADGDGLPPNVAPEHASCVAAAKAHDVPVKQVYAAAITAFAARS